jgi:hypothetical protein
VTDAEQTFEGVDDAGSLDGRRFVIGLYVALVGVAAAMGAILSVVLSGDATTITLLGVIDLPPTPLGFALYGTVTVGLALGVPLLAILYISDDET